MKEFKVYAGCSIETAVKDLIGLVKHDNAPCFMMFNTVRLEAHPGETFDQVIIPWDNQLREWAKAREAKEALANQIRNTKLSEMTGNGMVVTKEPPEGFVFTGQRWSKGSGLMLITPAQLASLPVGTVVTSIFGEEKIVGVDVIDNDTRGGHTAWGFIRGN